MVGSFLSSNLGLWYDSVQGSFKRTSGIGEIGHSVVSFFPVDELDLDALKGRSNAAGAVVVLKEGSKSSRLATINKT